MASLTWYLCSRYFAVRSSPVIRSESKSASCNDSKKARKYHEVPRKCPWALPTTHSLYNNSHMHLTCLGKQCILEGDLKIEGSDSVPLKVHNPDCSTLTEYKPSEPGPPKAMGHGWALSTSDSHLSIHHKIATVHRKTHTKKSQEAKISGAQYSHHCPF